MIFAMSSSQTENSMPVHTDLMFHNPTTYHVEQTLMLYLRLGRHKDTMCSDCTPLRNVVSSNRRDVLLGRHDVCGEGIVRKMVELAREVMKIRSFVELCSGASIGPYFR